MLSIIINISILILILTVKEEYVKLVERNKKSTDEDKSVRNSSSFRYLKKK